MGNRNGKTLSWKTKHDSIRSKLDKTFCDNGRWKEMLGNTVWRLSVAILSGDCRWQYCPATVCGNTVRRLSEAILSGDCLLQYCPATICGNIVRRTPVAIVSGDCLWQ